MSAVCQAGGLQVSAPRHNIVADEETLFSRHSPHQGKVRPIAASVSATRVRGTKGQPHKPEAGGNGQNTLTTRTLLDKVTDALADMKAVDVTVIPLAGMASFADFLVVATGTSTRHVSSIGKAVQDALGKHVYGMEGLRDGEWVCADLGDVVVHVFTPEKRAIYNLEKLWSHVF